MVWVSMAAVALLLLVVVLVLHNRRLQVAQLRQQALLEAKLERGLQTSALAHELRQPLSHLLLQSRLMQCRVEGGVADPQAVLEGVQNLQRSAQQIHQMIDTITALLRGQPGRKEPVDLVALVHELVASRCAERSLRQIQLHLDLPAEPVILELNKAQISIAIRNLLVNAQQALLEMEPQDRHLAVTLVQNAEKILVQVADSGPGLPSHSMRELLLNSTTADGMGLGLFTVHAIAKQHQGRLTLGRSQALRGAECSLWFQPCSVDPGTSIDRALPGAPVGNH
jgi:signal transduction histidine kinase